jgi:hypothetical protein
MNRLAGNDTPVVIKKEEGTKKITIAALPTLQAKIYRNFPSIME